MFDLAVAFRVVGRAATAGSKTTGRTADGRTFVRPANAREKDWKQRVEDAAAEAWGDRPPLDGPVKLSVVFFRIRPRSHYRASGGLSAVGERTPYPTTKPDSTKLLRAAEDAMRGICWRDDAQVVVTAVAKAWGLQNVMMVEVAAYRTAQDETGIAKVGGGSDAPRASNLADDTYPSRRAPVAG